MYALEKNALLLLGLYRLRELPKEPRASCDESSSSRAVQVKVEVEGSNQRVHEGSSFDSGVPLAGRSHVRADGRYDTWHGMLAREARLSRRAHGFRRFVAANPPASTPVYKSDLLYALEPYS